MNCIVIYSGHKKWCTIMHSPSAKRQQLWPHVNCLQRSLGSSKSLWREGVEKGRERMDKSQEVDSISSCAVNNLYHWIPRIPISFPNLDLPPSSIWICVDQFGQWRHARSREQIFPPYPEEIYRTVPLLQDAACALVVWLHQCREGLGRIWLLHYLNTCTCITNGD